MDDIDRWVHFGGQVPPSIRQVLEALREVVTPQPTAEGKARVRANVLEAVKGWRERSPTADEDEARAEELRGSLPPVEPVAPAAPAIELPSEDEVRAIARGVAPLGFEAWAALSIRFLGAGAEEKREALAARGLTAEEWRRIDDDYLRMLSADLLAGRTERGLLYSRTCNAEMLRRAEASGAPERKAAATRVINAEPRPFSGTGEAVDLPAALREAMGKLPFRAPAEGAPPAPAPAPRAVAKTKQVPVMRDPLRETLGLASDVMQQAVRAAMPFAGGQGTEAVVYFPVLTVQRYVSLRMDLETRPAEAAATLVSYGVLSEASHRALDEHWRQQLERPEVRAEAEVAATVYTTWLNAGRR
jgi:hypothetical protein